MRLTYETGTATLIQFIVIAFLNMAGAIDSIVVTCTHSGGTNCVPNALTSIIYYMLIVAWFGIIVILGYRAQTKRSKRTAQLLIAAEAAAFLVAAYNIKLGITYHNGVLGLFTSLIDLIMSAWVVTLAYRLIRAGGGRVVSRHRVNHNSSDT